MSEQKIQSRSVLLDTIRSFAIGLVVLGHIFQTIGNRAGGFFGIENFYYVSIGGIGVTVFLILSGISLELSYGKKQITYTHFIMGRIFRIYPIYYMSLLLGLIIYLFYNHFSCVDCNLSNLFFSVTGTYAFAGLWGGPFVATSWFIGLIMSLYLFYPLLSKLIKIRPLFILIIIFLISLFTRFILGNYHILPERPLDWFPLARIFEFGLGIYLVQVFKNNIWGVLNKYKNIGAILYQISAISFPLFLVHYPLLKLIKTFSDTTSLNLSILLYLIISILFGFIILGINNKIIKKQKVHP